LSSIIFHFPQIISAPILLRRKPLLKPGTRSRFREVAEKGDEGAAYKERGDELYEENIFHWFLLY